MIYTCKDCENNCELKITADTDYDTIPSCPFGVLKENELIWHVIVEKDGKLYERM